MVPTLNEEQAITSVVSSLRDHDLVDHVIVVDGGSDDHTARNAADAGAQVVFEPRRGYGRACLTGFEHAGHADVILFVDGDGADVVAQAHRLVDPILSGQAETVLGSRVRGTRDRGSMAPHQLVGNLLVAAVLRLRHGVNVTDVGPFRAVRARELRCVRDDRDDLRLADRNDRPSGRTPTPSI